MRVGIVAPQGWTGEFEGVGAIDAWDRMLRAAREADRLGFDSIWLYDHFHTTPDPKPTITFESFMSLAAIASATSRARIGHLVSCAGYRNPALAAKMISTLDVRSGGRAEFGVGAGWKEEEWRAYGYPFPSLRERQQRLRDSLEIARRMLRAAGRESYQGPTAEIAGAFNVPASAGRGPIPVMVGGNGRETTWRIAAAQADELNLDAMPPDELPGALADLANRCEEAGRDPAGLRVSVHIWWEHLRAGDPVELLAAYQEAGVSRVMTLARDAASDDEAVERLRDQAVRAGAEFDPIAAA
ncbi:MAG: LLM class flavin-dependent oxidoreductase [Chloroflexota bacterium]